MSENNPLSFGSYRLAGPRGPLTRDAREVALRPKSLQVLWYLATHANEVVAADRLMEAVWPGRVLSPGVLGVSIRELRQALDDDPRSPRYIRTIHRQGYCFLPTVVRNTPWRDEAVPRTPAAPMLGRETELARLNEWYRAARVGERQVVFVGGEAGIGKTTLVQTWARVSLADGEVWLGSGQCVEHEGAGEPFLCLLEALAHLCRDPGNDAAAAILRGYAPTWSAQLLGVCPPTDRDALEPPPPPATPRHYQHELANALEALGAVRPVVLILEDLHWADGATVEALAVIARRTESARLLVIGTTRPGELSARRHPLRALRQELAWHGRCHELELEALDEATVRTFVTCRLPAAPAAVAEAIYQRTGGHPLLMVSLVSSLAQRREQAGEPDAATLIEAASALPARLERLIEAQLQLLDAAEREILEAASVAGIHFAAAAVAAALELPVHRVELVCGELARREQLIAAAGPEEWADGTATETYTFRHGLYQEVLYRRVGVNRQVRMHRLIGERLARGHGAGALRIAGELAEHFERGRVPCHALPYLRISARTALERSAPRVAQTQIERALELIELCPRTPETAEEELRLQLARAVAWTATDGFGATAVAHAYHRAHALCRQMPNSTALGPVLSGLWNFFLTRADFEHARVLADELSQLLAGVPPGECTTPMHNAIGQTELFGGEPARALVHIEAGLAGYDPIAHRNLATRYGENPGVVCHMYAALAHWLLGDFHRASQHIDAGFLLAKDLEEPFATAQMHWAAMLVAQGRGDPVTVRAHAGELIRLCEQEDIGFWLGGGHILQGWADAATGKVDAGITGIRQGLAEWEAMGCLLIRPYYLALLAEAIARRGHVGDLDEAIKTVTQALTTVQRTDERWYEAQLRRMLDELGQRSSDNGHSGRRPPA